MTDLLIGIAVGAICGYMVANKLLFGKNFREKMILRRENDRLCKENEKLSNRLKEAKRTIEDVIAENKKLYRDKDQKEDYSSKIEDDIQNLRTQIKKLTRQNDELTQKLIEYKNLCATYEEKLSQFRS